MNVFFFLFLFFVGANWFRLVEIKSHSTSNFWKNQLAIFANCLAKEARSLDECMDP